DSLAQVQKAKDAAAALAAKNKRTADSLAQVQKAQDAAATLAAKQKRAADSIAAAQKSKDAAAALAAKQKRTADSLAQVQKANAAAAALAAKNKRTADSLAAVQKNKRTADSIATVQKANAAAIAAQKKKTADSLASANKDLNDKYNAAMAKGDQYLLTKNYKPALAAYQQASALKPNENLPKQRISQVQQQLALLGQQSGTATTVKTPVKDTVPKNNSAEKDSIALKYNQGVTEEHIDEPGCEVTRRIVVKGPHGFVYTRKVWSWGQTYYFKGEQPITEDTWNMETSNSN
ncbi:MAG TPA: hypothetical protein VK783_08315, partial [Bacteroidia bacterium]|nr:hypothetical protein [Bacteroidia bacterium]